MSLLLVAYGSATDHGAANHDHKDGNLNHFDHNWMHSEYDWLSPGGSNYWYPTTNYYSWYSIPYYSHTYYPTYYYTEPVYTPVVYHDWGMDPWWDANVYGYGTTYYYGGLIGHTRAVSAFGILEDRN